MLKLHEEKTEVAIMPKPQRGGRSRISATKENSKVGKISARAATLLGLMRIKNQPIMFGDSNRKHMREEHPEAYKKYGKHIPKILAQPDYVGLDEKDGSIEYVKEFKEDNDFVKVAVRIAGDGTLFARTIYVLKPSRVQNAIKTGYLKKY